MANPTPTHAPVRLTKRIVDAASSEAREYILWDTDLSGFGLRITPAGRKTFLLKYLTKGRTARKPTIGVFGNLTVEEARGIAKDWLVIIARGGDPKGQRDSDRESPSFAALAERFIEEYAKPQKRSWGEDQRILLGAGNGESGASPAKVKGGYFVTWHARKANSITPGEIAERLAVIAESNGPIMANRARSCLSRMYAWASKNHRVAHIEVNPVRDVERPSRETESERVYVEDEIHSLWAAFDELGTVGQIYKLMMVTGQRLNEVAGMSWPELDGAGEIWTLPGARTKNKRVHVVPLSNFAREILDHQRGKNEKWVFPSSRADQPITITDKMAKSVKKGSGVTDFKSHDLRRTMATGCTRLGITRFIVDRLLNHVEPGVGRVYDRHDYLEEKTKTADAWARRLKNILGQDESVVQLSSKAV